jgi:hypothetical protein
VLIIIFFKPLFIHVSDIVLFLTFLLGIHSLIRYVHIVNAVLRKGAHARLDCGNSWIGVQATVSLKVVSRKRRRKCTLKSYDRLTNS